MKEKESSWCSSQSQISKAYFPTCFRKLGEAHCLPQLSPQAVLEPVYGPYHASCIQNSFYHFWVKKPCSSRLLRGCKDWHDLIVVCNEEHRFLVAEQLRQIGIENATILLEPVARNTAPAIAMAAYEAIRRNEEAVLPVLIMSWKMHQHSRYDKKSNANSREREASDFWNRA